MVTLPKKMYWKQEMMFNFVYLQIENQTGAPTPCLLECKMVKLLWKTVWHFIRKLNIYLPYDLATSLLIRYLPNRNGSLWSYRDLFMVALFVIRQKLETNHISVNRNKLWYICVRKYSAIKRNELLIHAMTWLNLKKIIWNRKRQIYMYYTVYNFRIYRH